MNVWANEVVLSSDSLDSICMNPNCSHRREYEKSGVRIANECDYERVVARLQGKNWLVFFDDLTRYDSSIHLLDSNHQEVSYGGYDYQCLGPSNWKARWSLQPNNNRLLRIRTGSLYFPECTSGNAVVHHGRITCAKGFGSVDFKIEPYLVIVSGIQPVLTQVRINFD